MNKEQTLYSPSAVALGNFDGLHLGHREIINNLLNVSKEKGLSPFVFMFKDLPKNDIAHIMTNEMRFFSIESIGINTYTVDFKDVCNYTPEEFFENILIKKLNAKALFCGYNYTFGKGASGNVESLKKLCDENSVELYVTEEVDYEGSAINSSRIRKEIENGNIGLANAMLGYAFSYKLKVVGGDKRGRLIGAPTINQFFPENFVIPKFGVYASMTLVDGYYHPSVTNIGLRPTIGKGNMRSETCILNYKGNLYGKNIDVALLDYIRPEIKFDNLDELSAQIKKDAESAKSTYTLLRQKNIKAVLFDFDDTLQDRKAAYEIYCHNFLNRYFPDFKEKKIKSTISEMENRIDGGYRNRIEYFKELIDIWHWENSPTPEELAEDYNTYFGKNVVLLDGVADTLKYLRDKGYKLCIVSNGPSSLQNDKIDSSGLRELLDNVIVSGDYQIHKPDKRLFDIAAKSIGVNNCECVFVGDHPINDIQGAIAAGMHPVWMNFGSFKDKIKYDITSINSISSLKEFL